MMKIGIVYLLIFLFPIISFGQIISGKIIDRISAEPIPYANILIKDSHSGTVSNEDGEFEISVIKSKNEIKLVISVIGYKTAQIQLSKDTHYPNLVIELEENVFELNEVVISYLSANQIFDNFHKNYSTNYYQESALLKAFYHSALSENDEFKHLLEATINVREFSKKKHRTFEVEITQRRKSNDYRIERWGEKNNYLFDAIASNPMLELSDFLDKKNKKYYELERLPNTTYNSESVYVVQFTPKKNTTKPLYKAIAYFNSNDFALIKAEYEFNNDEEKIKNQSLKDKTYHIPFISGSFQYQKIDEYYILKYLGYNNGWTVINNISNDTIVKDILKDEILFYENQYDYSKPLVNPLTKWGDIYKKPFGYDAEYWNNQVKIPPSQLFEKALEDLEKRQPIEIQYFNNSANNIGLPYFENTIGGSIDSILTVYNLTKLFNGVALVTSNGEIIHHKAYGYQNIQDSILLDTSTVFDIGSITKQFTTAIILKLRFEGKLNLENKIGKYLPNYRYADKITIHQLLAHRSGIPTYDYQEKLNDSKWFNTKLSTNEMVDTFCSDDLEFEPDTKMEYSNSNFIILTAIIEEIEGKDYYSVLDELILKPLNMNNTYSPVSLPAKNVAKGYILEGNNYTIEPEWAKSNSKGSGNTYSTSTDLLKWLYATNSSELLDAKDRSLIKSPISYYEYYDSDFGYSWGINRDMFEISYPTYFYGGTSLGFFSMITTVPEKGINIILLSNTGNFPRIELTNEILKIIK